MKDKKSPFRPKVLLWWVAIIALGVSAAIYFGLEEQAKYDVTIAQRRILAPVIGIVIAGVCIITGTAERWFYPK